MKTAILIYAIVLNMFLCVSAQAGPKPSPTPDLSNVTPDDILATIKHKDELLSQQTTNIQNIIDTVAKQQATLGQATQAVLTLQKQIATQATENTELKVANAKKDEAIWRDLVLGLGAGFVIGLFGPQILKLAGTFGV